MGHVFVAGAGMTRFAKHRDLGLKDLTRQAVTAALEDAGLRPEALEAAFVANAVAGLITGQETIRGQVVLRAMGLGGLPVINVENACAGASTALHLAAHAVAAGQYERVLCLGVEKMTCPDKRRTFAAIASGLDVEAAAEEAAARGVSEGAGEKRSVFMDYYAARARAFLAERGRDARDLAWVAHKNRAHAGANPFAQYREPLSVEAVLADVPVVDPFTRAMCSPVADGAAAVIVSRTPPPDRRAVRVAASALVSAAAPGQALDDVVRRASRRAYETAGVGPADVDVAEVHDAAASAELMAYEQLGLCPEGEAPGLVAEEATRLGGRLPVNPSGGLECRGHPVGATGLGQLVELTWQLEGRAEGRQIPGARVALAQNAGGHLGDDNATCAVTLLTA
jgi:acetyl-CoA acetyltransferase